MGLTSQDDGIGLLSYLTLLTLLRLHANIHLRVHKASSCSAKITK